MLGTEVERESQREGRMIRQIQILFIVLGFFLALAVPSRSNAEIFRVGFPSLATGFAPSWVTADKEIWKKHGLEVELIYLRGGSRTVSALIGGSVAFILRSDLGVTTAILQGAGLTPGGGSTTHLCNTT